MIDALDKRFFVTPYTLLGRTRFRVCDVMHPNDHVKDVVAGVDKDDFATREEADALCVQLNGE